MATPRVADKSWSSAQQLVALSIGEAELYALVKGASQTKGIISTHVDLDHKFGGMVCTDASATVGRKICEHSTLSWAIHVQTKRLSSIDRRFLTGSEFTEQHKTEGVTCEERCESEPVFFES